MQCALDPKAKVEQAVLIVERWLLGRLRHRTFYSLADVNVAIADLMTHSMNSGRSAGSAQRAGNCWRRSIGHR
jgi:hypothetical protein